MNGAPESNRGEGEGLSGLWPQAVPASGGLFEDVPGGFAALAAIGTDAETAFQVPQGAGAQLGALSDFALGYAVADADVHVVAQVRPISGILVTRFRYVNENDYESYRRPEIADKRAGGLAQSLRGRAWSGPLVAASPEKPGPEGAGNLPWRQGLEVFAVLIAIFGIASVMQSRRQRQAPPAGQGGLSPSIAAARLAQKPCDDHGLAYIVLTLPLG